LERKKTRKEFKPKGEIKLHLGCGKRYIPGFIHKDYDDFSQADIPHMDKEKVLLISFNVEAEKP
jgi:hypothetical protein